MKEVSEFNANTARVMKEATVVRKRLSKRSVVFVGMLPDGVERNYAGNFSAMVNNRAMDVFDDASLLLTNRRYPSACVISRGLIETYAFGKSALDSVTEELDAKGADAANEEMIRIINSSFFKVKEQRALKGGKFELHDYQFTDRAKARMIGEEASIVRVGKALEKLFKQEIDATGHKESRLELVYDTLCEWTHPSQNSLFHTYCSEAHLTPTSLGPVHIWDGARSACAQGLHFITAVPSLCAGLDDLGKRIVAMTPVK